MLKMTNIKLELMTDINMLQFVERWNKLYSKLLWKSKQKNMTRRLSMYIMYLDANNLYGWAMSLIFQLVVVGE